MGRAFSFGTPASLDGAVTLPAPIQCRASGGCDACDTSRPRYEVRENIYVFQRSMGVVKGSQPSQGSRPWDRLKALSSAASLCYRLGLTAHTDSAGRVVSSDLGQDGPRPSSDTTAARCAPRESRCFCSCGYRTCLAQATRRPGVFARPSEQSHIS